LKHKGEAFTQFWIFKQMIELETGNKICILCSDRGGKYLSTEFISFCSTSGIKQELTQPNTPQQNGVAEQQNRTIMERA